MLAVERDVNPRNMNFAKVEKGGGGGGGVGGGGGGIYSNVESM